MAGYEMALHTFGPLAIGYLTAVACRVHHGIVDDGAGVLLRRFEPAQSIVQLARALNGDVAAVAASHQTGYASRTQVSAIGDCFDQFRQSLAIRPALVGRIPAIPACTCRRL